MVPEVEYLALLSMIKGDDAHKTEKAIIDAKIQQNFNNRNITEDVRARKYDWLLKQKRKLRELIEGKPQKVVIENLPTGPNVAPYMGINQPQTPITPVNTNRKIKRRSRARNNATVSIPTGDSSIDTGSTRSSTSSEDYPNDTALTPQGSKTPFPKSLEEGYSTDATIVPARHKTPLKRSSKKAVASPLINPEYFDMVKAHVDKNRKKYGVLDNGSILTNFKAPVSDSHYVDTLLYLTGQISTPPKGSSFLRTNLLRDPEFKNLFTSQRGEGKINRKMIVVKIKPIKTPGLKREKKLIFKPKFWAKL
jgi:hypothetical protein